MVSRNNLEQYIWIGFVAFFPVVGFVAPRSAAALVAVATIVTLGLFLWNERSFRALRSPIWIPFAVSLALLLFAGLVDGTSSHGIDRFSKLSLFLLIGVLLLLLIKNRMSQNGGSVDAALLVGYSAGLVLLAFQLATQHGLYGLLNPNNDPLDILHAANRPSVVMVLCFSAAFLAVRKTWSPAAGWVLGGVLIMLVAMSESQSAGAGMVVWMVVYGVAAIAPNLAIQLATWGGAGLILSMPFVFLVLLKIDTERAIEIPAASVGARLDIWYATSLEVLHSPIWGHGLEASRSIKDWQIDFVYFVGPNIPHPHNGPLQIWLDLGAIGAVVAAAIWVYLSRKIRSYSLDQQPALIAGLVAFLCILSISHGVWQSWWISVVFGVIGITSWIAKPEITDTK
ncbi:O-antigen ligase [Rhodobiaceae bacterium]|nr:O-antigen ligase [Rhodobiaceae bacterium]